MICIACIALGFIAGLLAHAAAEKRILGGGK